MKAVVWHGIDDIRLDDVPDPGTQEPTDAVVRVTTSAICGTDLHLVRGTIPGLAEGTILGHEAVGEVVDVGPQVRNFSRGDRVIVASSIACGFCSYCRAGYPAMCDNANPVGKKAGTAYYGGPRSAGGYDGLQAEYARIPFASYNLVGVPSGMSDQQAIMLSDVFPTAWFGGRLAEIGDGDTVAVFGAGPVGQLCVVSAFLQGAGRVIVVDRDDDRLAVARLLHAETINFDTEDPVAAIEGLTGGIGVDRVIDAVGVDAQQPGGAGRGDAPGQVLTWAVRAVAKAGSIGVVGLYPRGMSSFPFGEAMAKNLTVKAGDCNHRRYLPQLLAMVSSGAVDPSILLTEDEPMTDMLDAYHEFDRREPGWLKVALQPTTSA
jgi:threonine dehydrogenase-like Zn-dependent dehydrogenase